METAPLKSFATWARTSLIREVTARIAVVLAPASRQRVEEPGSVTALEAAITAAGGGDKGRSAVADRVAYTWFNRIIALRFMDANGYNGIGVVSPQAGVEVGQPEILAEAKRANIDPEIVHQKIRDTVTGLLNGTRRSDDPQGEAYATLLVEYCRHWNRSMPFMFEREGDFSELLMPSNLLADDSVLNRAVKVMTGTVCEDVEVIGWLYQFYTSERKDEIFAGFKKNKKAGPEDIPAATQLFTPHWIVRYVVQNSLGRLWMLNRPSSRLIDEMDYYVPPPEEIPDFIEIGSPEEIKVMDPACGSGHMLTYAFDLLYAIYEEEGYAPSDIPTLILKKNLYGTEIDPRAGALAAFALTMKARARQRTLFSNKVEPSICVLETISFTPAELDVLVTRDGDRQDEIDFWNRFEHSRLLGALIEVDTDLLSRLGRMLGQVPPSENLLDIAVIDQANQVVRQAEFLSQRYDIVVANPPYMGVRNMSSQLAGWLECQFPDYKSDLFSAFVRRCQLLVKRGGRVGIMSPNVWMYISSHEKLRTLLCVNATLETLVELPLSAFKGATVQICAYTFTASPSHGSPAVFLRLTDMIGTNLDYPRIAQQAISTRDDSRVFVTNPIDFRQIPGSPIAYWLQAEEISNYHSGHLLGDLAEPRKGMDTGDNSEFLRMWWEVSRHKLSLELADRGKWFPYNKGGGFRRWYGNRDTVINWADDGAEIRARLNWNSKKPTLRNQGYMKREGFTWGTISSGGFSARYSPPGALFDNGGCTLFSESSDLNRFGALMNSTTMDRYLKFLAPTLNFQPGDVGKVPVPSGLENVEVHTQRCIEIARADWDSREESFGFDRSPLVGEFDEIQLAFQKSVEASQERTRELADLEAQHNCAIARVYGLQDLVPVELPIQRVTLYGNPAYRYGADLSGEALWSRMHRDAMEDLVSYAVGCMFGRYSLDEPGLILADQGATLQDYLARVPSPSFNSDIDNVIPIVDGDWFEDDIVTRFRQFLRVAFGERNFEENLRFVTEALGVKDLRDYFVKSFYKDHVQRYKKRPIYWLFSSPKGSFNALIYMHRYTPSTVSTVLNEYLREFKAKLEATLGQQERLAAGEGTPRQQAAAQKEADRIRKMLLEFDEYEHDVLYPLASQQIEIDLDDGVKVNYPKFGAALKKIPGLEAGE